MIYSHIKYIRPTCVFSKGLPAEKLFSMLQHQTSNTHTYTQWVKDNGGDACLLHESYSIRAAHCNYCIKRIFDSTNLSVLFYWLLTEHFVLNLYNLTGSHSNLYGCLCDDNSLSGWPKTKRNPQTAHWFIKSSLPRSQTGARPHKDSHPITHACRLTSHQTYLLNKKLPQQHW